MCHIQCGIGKSDDLKEYVFYYKNGIGYCKDDFQNTKNNYQCKDAQQGLGLLNNNYYTYGQYKGQLFQNLNDAMEYVGICKRKLIDYGVLCGSFGTNFHVAFGAFDKVYYSDKTKLGYYKDTETRFVQPKNYYIDDQDPYFYLKIPAKYLVDDKQIILKHLKEKFEAGKPIYLISGKKSKHPSTWKRLNNLSQIFNIINNFKNVKVLPQQYSILIHTDITKN